MNTPIKPRYRLGTQRMLDLAKDDARLIPENTLFKVVNGELEEDTWSFLSDGEFVVRGKSIVFDQDGVSSVRFVCVDAEADPGFGHAHAGMLKPFI